MSKPISRAVPGPARIAIISGLLLSVAGCSSEVSRLSQPFFSREDATGSLLPPEPVYGVGLAANSRPQGNTNSQTVARSSISSAPLAPAPGTTMSSGPISTRNVQQAAYSPPPQPNYATQPTYAPQQTASYSKPNYAPQPAYGQQRGYAQQQAQLQPHRLPAPQTKLARRKPAGDGQVHKVAYGDTVYSIARRYDVSVSEIIADNNLSEPDSIRVGQNLRIPGGTYAGTSDEPVRVAASNHIQTDAAPTPVARPMTQQSFTLQPRPQQTQAHPQYTNAPRPRQVATTPVQGSPINGGQTFAAPQPPQVGEQRTAMLAPSRMPVAQPKQNDDLAEPDGLSAGKFRWPARGRVIGQFGSRPNGVQNDGINIAVPEGTSIKAAEAGVVAYVGNELKGYGNLILIRHAEDWVTAYAHNSEVLVRRGDTVQRGQIIAKAGRTGNVDQPQLHFEIRKGSKPQDPLQQLPST